MNNSPIYQIYHDILKNSHLYNHDLNNRITKIVSNPDYDPDQWVIQYHEIENPQKWHGLIFELMLYHLDPKHYEAFPTEWWMLVHECCSSILKRLIDETQNEFLQRILLLSQLQ